MSADRFTEILNYLSAMSREMGEFRTETKKRFDGIESRLDGVENRLGKVEVRLDGVETRLTNFETEVRAEFDKVHGNIRRLHHKFGSVLEELAESKIENRYLRKRVEAIEKKVGIAEDL